METLDALGWNDGLDAQFHAFQEFHGLPCVPGRVVAVDRGEVEVVTPDKTMSCRVATESQTLQWWPPTVGDWVGVDNQGVAFVLPRRTFVERPSSHRGSSGQIIAANVDVLVIVDPLPAFSPGRVERMTALARHSGIEAWLVATKSDVVNSANIADLLHSVNNTVDRIFITSTQDQTSFSALKEALGAGMTAVVFGRSGAGKSTLINILTGAQLATRLVREKDGKGRHQTTRRTLIAARGLVIIDSPGIREIAAVENTESIGEVFQDISALAEKCYFSDCSHETEPDCAVQWAICEGILDPHRLERYRRMLYESRRNDPKYATEQRHRERQESKNNKRGRRFAMEQKGRAN